MVMHRTVYNPNYGQLWVSEINVLKHMSGAWTSLRALRGQTLSIHLGNYGIDIEFLI